MDTDFIPTHYVEASGHAYYRDGDELCCAPLLADGGVDWDGSTIVEECPIEDKEETLRILDRLGFDPATIEKRRKVTTGTGRLRKRSTSVLSS